METCAVRNRGSVIRSRLLTLQDEVQGCLRELRNARGRKPSAMLQSDVCSLTRSKDMGMWRSYSVGI